MALSPPPAITFGISHGLLTLAVLGAVFLAVTGAEALYADHGHFGPNPIRLAGLGVTLPALLVNYLGQGAMVLARPETFANPFVLMFPDAALLSIVALATAATNIAAQAVITGACSLTRQAIQLRLLPRMRMRHASATQEGQIFMPGVNLALLVAVVALVLAFGSSASLANAYGIAVTGTMVVTAMRAIVVVNRHWHWPLAGVLALILPFLVIDLIFLGANLLKVVDGGYVPLLMASAMGLLMWTWLRGTALIVRKEVQATVSFEEILRQILKRPLPVIPGTAVSLTWTPEVAPAALLHSLKHFKSLHEMIVILTIQAMPVPRVSDEDRTAMTNLGPRFRKVTMRFGYMEDPNVPQGLLLRRKQGWKFDIMSTAFLLSRRRLKLAAASDMPIWQRQLYLFLARNASDASDYFHIPAGRVVEIGTQVNLWRQSAAHRTGGRLSPTGSPHRFPPPVLPLPPPH